MNLSSFKKLSQEKKLGGFLIATTLAWSLGLPFLVGTATAASLTNISDTIVSSAPSVATNHTIVYTSITAVAAAQTIRVQFSPGNSGGATDEFTLPSFATSTDITISGSVAVNEVANLGACSATGSEVYNSAVNNIAGNRYTDFTVCTGDTVAPQIITISFINSKIVNPTTVNSYVVRVAGTQTDSADTRVAIVNTVTMSAKVDTSFTFTITGLATSTSVNGTTTEIATTATQIAFNTLTPGVKKTGAQRLNVTTNAQNGFIVTVVQNQNLVSSTLADIDLFKDASEVAVPTAWTQPLNTLGNADTYGHYGVTSEDDLNANEFSASKFAGNINTPRQVFSHNGPSNGIAVNIGETDVGFQVEIGPLQEAANDYSNTLTYVATPTF